MGLAPLDVWARLLWSGGRRGRLGGGWRYLPRVGFALLTSFVATVLTLPERVVLGVWLRARDCVRGGGRGGGPRIERETVVITGYYRSGTTHLHNLMSCDRRFVTPRWVQALAPQGWVVSWWALRLAMLPFAPNERPQDGVGFGPWWPAEDDFALANWSLASPLPGRFVYPSQREEWSRWHDLEGLSEREMRRWRRTLAWFCWKVCVGSGKGRLLLKTPSHTARVAELDRLCAGEGDRRVRFVHVVRDEDAVLRSNVVMQGRLGRYGLEDAEPEGTTRAAILREMHETEARFEREAAALEDADRRVAVVRYEDLALDPVGAVRGVYEGLGLGWDDRTEGAVRGYAERVAGYRAEHGENGTGAGLVADAPGSSRAEEPPHPSPLPQGREGARPEPPRRAGWVVVPLVAAGCLAAWLGIGWATGERFDSLVWLWGLVIGWCGLWAGRRGSAGLGWWCAAWVVVVVGVAVWPMPEVSAGWVGVDRVKNIRTAYLTKPTSVHVTLVFGVVTAYRVGSRRQAGPPGR
ncbi:MAG: hypothetical protein ACI89L_001429 [Phycisphaerales bacterium]|jgi:hypothetical protein